MTLTDHALDELEQPTHDVLHLGCGCWIRARDDGRLELDACDQHDDDELDRVANAWMLLPSSTGVIRLERIEPAW